MLLYEQSSKSSLIRATKIHVKSLFLSSKAKGQEQSLKTRNKVNLTTMFSTHQSPDHDKKNLHIKCIIWYDSCYRGISSIHPRLRPRQPHLHLHYPPHRHRR